MKRIFSLLFFLLIMQCLNGQQNSIEYYIDKAIHNSPLLVDFQNQIKLAQIDSLRMKAGLGFQVSANSDNLYAPVIKGWGYDNAITNGANISALISVSKELTGTHTRQNKFDAISLQSQSIRNSSKITEQELKKNVSSVYITAFGSWQQYNYNNELLILLLKQKDILKNLAEAGSVKQIDYLSFLVNLQQQEIQVEHSKNQYQNDFAQLNYICGIEDTSLSILTDPNLKIESNSDFPGSIFYKQFEIDSLKLVNSDQQINLFYNPKISLVADGGYLSSLAVKPFKNFGISAGVSVNIPLYDGGQRKMQHDQITINQLTRLNYRDFYASQYRQQKNQLWQQLQDKLVLEQKISQQIGFSKSLIEAYQKLLQSGDIQITDYLLALGNYRSVKNMLLENTIEKYQIINELNYWNRTK
jgi:outer membrane protein TolC